MTRDYTKKAETRGSRIREAGMAHNQLGEGTVAEIQALRARVAELEKENQALLNKALEGLTKADSIVAKGLSNLGRENNNVY